MQTHVQALLRREQDPAVRALRELFRELMNFDEPLRHVGKVIAATDVRYSLPNADGRALTGSFAPDLNLNTERGATSVAALMKSARPILLDLAGRSDLRETAQEWYDRIDIYTADTDHRPADAILIRPDGHSAWAAMIAEPTDTATLTLRKALSTWFGSPVRASACTVD